MIHRITREETILRFRESGQLLQDIIAGDEAAVAAKDEAVD